ncbi:putative negative regulator of RcsB-dependent stress response [Bradyrhizobium sp. LB8.2]|uniref:hypothetical protein n=1 Tax=unclassified Bradyrhizobium TaxID=2631580 RepID=UPI0033979E82
MKKFSVADHTFKDAKAALAHAKALFETGEISKAEFSKLKQKLDPSSDIDLYLNKTYGDRRR